MRWQAAAYQLVMWGIRYAPLPWALKRRAIRLATPHMPVMATAIIPDESGGVLMLRARYSGPWIPPGGAIHAGESPLDGARRECREELGRDVQVQRLIGLYTLAHTRELFIAFLCAPLAGLPRLGPEHEAYAYTQIEHLPWWLRVVAADAARPAAEAPPVRTVRRT